MPDDLPSPGSRILLKLSGEILAGGSGSGVDRATVDRYAAALLDCRRAGFRPGVVTGGGNFIRGARMEGTTRWRADYMGMLATVINSLMLQDSIERLGGAARVLSAFPAGPAVEEFSPSRAVELLDSGCVVLFAGGTGNPFLTTDTAAALRAAQTGCTILLKGTKVDGVYDGDPGTSPGARRFDRLTYNRMLELDLRVMDAAAVAVCRDSRLPLVVFDATDPSNILRVLRDPSIGTGIREE
jgi:uridylate kinase